MMYNRAEHAAASRKKMEQVRKTNEVALAKWLQTHAPDIQLVKYIDTHNVIIIRNGETVRTRKQVLKQSIKAK